MFSDESDVRIPMRQIEVPRSASDDPSRSAAVDQLCAKHGLVFDGHVRGTPTRISVDRYGRFESLTFHYLAGGAR